MLFNAVAMLRIYAFYVLKDLREEEVVRSLMNPDTLQVIAFFVFKSREDCF